MSVSDLPARLRAEAAVQAGFYHPQTTMAALLREAADALEALRATNMVLMAQRVRDPTEEELASARAWVKEHLGGAT